MTVKVKVRGVRELNKRLDRLRKHVKGIKSAKKILKPGADVIRDIARTKVPVAGGPVRRTFKGRTTIYHPGNLKRGVQTMSWRKSPNMFVGFRFGKGGSEFKGRKVDSFYATWFTRGMHGRGKQKRRMRGKDYLLIALRQGSSRAFGRIAEEFKKELAKWSRSAG